MPARHTIDGAANRPKSAFHATSEGDGDAVVLRAEVGDIVSDLITEALEPKQAPAVKNGVPLFPALPGAPPDLELINPLRDEER